MGVPARGLLTEPGHSGQRPACKGTDQPEHAKHWEVPNYEAALTRNAQDSQEENTKSQFRTTKQGRRGNASWVGRIVNVKTSFPPQVICSLGWTLLSKTPAARSVWGVGGRRAPDAHGWRPDKIAPHALRPGHSSTVATSPQEPSPTVKPARSTQPAAGRSGPSVGPADAEITPGRRGGFGRDRLPGDDL